VKNAHTAPTSVGVNADPAQAGSGLAAKAFAPGRMKYSGEAQPLTTPTFVWR
jgi:hypothetical protein